MNNIVNMLDNALKNNELEDFLLGNDNYFIVNKESNETDHAVSLYSGIYEYYSINKNIKNLFEKQIINMLESKEDKIIAAFDYIYLQLLAEINDNSPFKLSDECYKKLKISIINNEEKLKKYKINEETSGFSYISNINSFFTEELGHKIL